MKRDEPTYEQLKASGLTRTEYDRLNKLWHRMLREVEPDERERICADPHGPEARALATTVHCIAEACDERNGK